MNLEQFFPYRVNTTGFIPLSMDTVKPSMDFRVDGDRWVEQRTPAGQPGGPLDSSAAVYRKVDSEGTLEDWACIIYPNLSTEILTSINQILYGSGPFQAFNYDFSRFIQKKLPNLKLDKAGLELRLDGKVVKVSAEKADAPTSPARINEVHGARLPAIVDIPFQMDPGRFFSGDINTTGVTIGGSMKLAMGNLQGLDTMLYRLGETIQSGLFTDESLREYADVTFNCERADTQQI